METNKEFELFLFKKAETKEIYAGLFDYYGFSGLPFELQWGVYLEFFDSVGIKIEVFGYWNGNGFTSHVNGMIINKPNPNNGGAIPYDTRTEAQKEAVKKAFQILETKN